VRFEMGAHSPRVEVVAGAPFQIGAGVRNDGGAGRGLSIVVCGEALDRGLLAPSHAEMVVGTPQRAARVEAPFAPVALTSGSGQVARFADLELPAGCAGGLSALRGLDPTKLIERVYASNLHCNVHGRVLAPGSAPLALAFLTEGAEYAYSIEVVSAQAPRAPLRGAGSAHDYAVLEAPDVLVAMAVSTLDAERTSTVAALAIEAWSEVWPRDGKLACAISESPDLARPAKPRMANVPLAAGLTSGRGWKKVRAALATARHVSGQRWAGGPEAFVVDGFELGGTLFVPRAEDDPELPVLRLSVDLRGRSDADALLARARATIDDFVTKTRGAQAFVARWKWNAGFGVDTTAYERACGVHGTCTVRRSWSETFLRAVSADGVWLGPALLGRVPDRRALEAVATTERVGDALRVVLREGASMDALEAAFAPLLPSAEDHRRGVDRVFGR
jgi:hypothetical protein